MCGKKAVGGIGFKRIHEFNVALLGKQGWRLFTRPELLVSQVYRARYYPIGNFLDAGWGSNPSYAWRIITLLRGLFMMRLVF